ncbi:MAG: hypothetical protein ACRD0N_00620 [Acidimicrobiales bacterium]
MAAMNRREFLLASAGLALVAACGGGDDGDDEVARVSTPDGRNGPGTTLNVVPVSYLHVAGIDQRLALGVLNDEGTGPMALKGDIEVTIGGTPVEAAVHSGNGTPIPYLLVRHRFDAPGPVMAKVTMEGRAGEAAIDVKDPGGVQLPIPGRPMIATPSPTPANTMGVDPICTRKPACPLHDVSLDAALAEQRPLAVLFSTPALCQSQFCGPVLDNLLSQQAEFGDRARFLHVEIYADLSGTQNLAPTVKAYHLEEAGEPLLFLAGADGVVRDRIDNAFDRVEARAALEQLVAG